MARILGVSHSTVSRALRDSPEIGPLMKQKVRDLALNLNYRPNAFARNLVRQKSEHIGIIIPDIENPFYASLCKRIIRFFENNNYKTIICNSDRDTTKEKSHIEYLEELQVAGILMVPADVNQESFMHLTTSGVPLVLIDHDGTKEKIDSVMGNNFIGACIAVKHLISLGYTKIAHISGPENADPSLARLKGYLHVVSEFFSTDFEPIIIHSDSTFTGGYEASKSLFSGKYDFDAVFTVNDVTALSLLQVVNERGLRVPYDVSVVGFDDISMARMASVPLTTMRQVPEDIAREAGNILLDKMQTGYSDSQRNIFLTPELIIRDSCGSKLRV
ncbi:hypothetical protein B4O97_04085 [Marispirochaeta aestuarii]|uniref:HTH lacI-type domain-containing protein n=2 Tax=Marispirochaeta aestuarii TaxID=1963862 RepID=A0A1Y1S1J3_9SPIO|nr:hypothetical protein B4O97_04085 [Marispirochaeta aestuarii]